MIKNDKETVVLLRCMEFGVREREISAEIEAAIPDISIYPVVDVMNLDSLEVESRRKELPDHSILLTRELINSLGLSHVGPKTGWICGDYPLYAALSKDWDFAWIVEPDVFFTGNSLAALKEISDNDSDLITTRFRKVNPSWVWTKPLNHFYPDLEVYGILFPLNRISRRLAEKCFEARQGIEISARINGYYGGQFKVPNDESVVASTAVAEGFSVLDLEQSNFEAEVFFSSSARYCLDDLNLAGLSAIVHKGEPDAGAFDRWLDVVFENTLAGHAFGAYRLTQAFRSLERNHALAVNRRFFDRLYKLSDPERKAFFELSDYVKAGVSAYSWTKQWYYKQLSVQRTLVLDWSSRFGPLAVDIAVDKGGLTISLVVRNKTNLPKIQNSSEFEKLGLRTTSQDNRYLVAILPWVWGYSHHLEQTKADSVSAVLRIRDAFENTGV